MNSQYDYLLAKKEFHKDNIEYWTNRYNYLMTVDLDDKHAITYVKHTLDYHKKELNIALHIEDNIPRSILKSRN